ncbi:copper resistance CopC/CopD family protein [Streptomyces sp. NPDC017086]|uniref:copper resistance CopC/CopD family protein n=1 Tax=Streptomyces sp. NPDC017086 TaxID=3364976 RepID=UPI0037A3796B
MPVWGLALVRLPVPVPGPRSVPRPRTVLALLPVLLLGLVLGTAAPASAHTVLRGADPADGSVLRTAPRRITLVFTEPVGLPAGSFRVYDPGNHRVRTGPAGHAPGRSDTARVTLPGGLATGTYTVAWRVVSADSHPVSGALTFSVGERTAAPPVPLPDRTENRATTALHTIARCLAYLSLALLLGTAAFTAYCRPPASARLRPLALTGAATLGAATTAGYLLRAPYEEGTSPATALSLSVLAHTATTRPGLLLLARLALLLLAAGCAALLRRRRIRPPRRVTLAATAVLALALSLTWTASDHAAAGIQVPAALVSATLHLLATAAWLGGLAALLRTLRRAPAGGLPASVPERFSRLATVSVTVLALTGVYQSWRGLGSWQALTDTAYGRTLLAKLAAVTALLLAAACSRTWTRRAARGPVAPHLLRRSVLAETTAAVLVLALTTLLTGTAPGRTATRSAPPVPAPAALPTASVTTLPFDTGAPGGHGRVQITLDPGRVGENSVQAVVYGPDGGLAAVPELRVTLTLPARRVGPLDTRLTDRGGYWAADAFVLPSSGTWTLKATVRVSEVDQATASAPLQVPNH